MSETIGSLNYAMGLDTSKFTVGARLAKDESRHLRRELKSIETPAEAYKKRLQQIDNLYKKGALDASQYRRAVDNIGDEFDKSSSKTGSFKSMLGMLPGPLGAISTAAGPIGVAMIGAAAGMKAFNVATDLTIQLVKDVLSEFDTIDNIGKVSAKIGIATEDLIGLRHAANQMAGVSDGQFDQALQRMTRRIAEAANGTGEAKDALKQLGLDAKELTKDPAKALESIADAMQGVGSRSEQLRLAFKLFDSEGAALVNMFNGGSQAIRGMQQDAEDLFLTFDSIDASKIEAANDQFERMGKLLTGLKQQAAIAVADELNAGLTTTVQVTQELISAFDETQRGLRILAGLSGAYATNLQVAVVATNTLYPGTKNLIELYEDNLRRIQLGDVSNGGEHSNSDSIASTIEPQVGGSGIDSMGLTGLGDGSPGTLGQKKRPFDKPFEDPIFTAEKARQEAAERRLKEWMRASKEMQRDADKVRDSLMTPFEKFEKEVDRLEELRDKGFLKADEFEEAKAQARKQILPKPLGPEAVVAGTQAARDIELKLRGFGERQREKKTQHQQTVEELLREILESAGIEVTVDGADPGVTGV